jgi:hypothetical protein
MLPFWEQAEIAAMSEKALAISKLDFSNPHDSAFDGDRSGIVQHAKLVPRPRAPGVGAGWAVEPW